MEVFKYTVIKRFCLDTRLFLKGDTIYLILYEESKKEYKVFNGNTEYIGIFRFPRLEKYLSLVD